MKEYGGYLPFELKAGKPYHDVGSDNILKCNSGLTAMYCALQSINPKRVHLPYFICPTVDRLIASMGIELVQYHITEKFEPIDLNCPDEDCVILVDYFGLNSSMVQRNYSGFKNVIIDNTQAFFSAPVFRTGVFNIYSCRKFIGTPDGGYLIGTEISDIPLEQDHSSPRSSFLLKQYEYGINGAYRESLENYEQIKDERKKMSVLTDKILEAADYSFIKYKRQQNFEILHRYLKDRNILELNYSPVDVPYHYPFMVKKDIRAKLVERKIYIPWIWKEKGLDGSNSQIEKDFTNFIYHLPIDQRYGEKEMRDIADIVIERLEEV